jgi:uncharacterized membrane protein
MPTERVGSVVILYTTIRYVLASSRRRDTVYTDLDFSFGIAELVHRPIF